MRVWPLGIGDEVSKTKEVVRTGGYLCTRISPGTPAYGLGASRGMFRMRVDYLAAGRKRPVTLQVQIPFDTWRAWLLPLLKIWIIFSLYIF